MKTLKQACCLAVLATFGAGICFAAELEEPQIEYSKELKEKLAEEGSEAKQVKIATKEVGRCESDFKAFAKKATKQTEKQAKEIAKKDEEIAKRDSANGCLSNTKTGIIAGAAGALVGASTAMALADNRYAIEEEFALVWECINGGTGGNISSSQYQKLAKCCAGALRDIQKEYPKLKDFQKSGTALGASCR